MSGFVGLLVRCCTLGLDLARKLKTHSQVVQPGVHHAVLLLADLDQPVKKLRQWQREHLDELAVLQLGLRVLVVLVGQVDVHRHQRHVGIGQARVAVDGEVGVVQQHKRAVVARLLKQLPHGGGLHQLVGVDQACGQLNHHAGARRAELLDQHHLLGAAVVAEQPEDADGVQAGGFGSGCSHGHFPHPGPSCGVRVVDFAGLDPVSLVQVLDGVDVGVVGRMGHVSDQSRGVSGDSSQARNHSGKQGVASQWTKQARESGDLRRFNRKNRQRCSQTVAISGELLTSRWLVAWSQVHTKSGFMLIAHKISTTEYWSFGAYHQLTARTIRRSFQAFSAANTQNSHTMADDLDAIRAKIQNHLVSLGNYDIISKQLKLKLYEAGWFDEVTQEANKELQEHSETNFDLLYTNLRPKAEKMVPESVREEIMGKIKQYLDDVIE